MKAGSRVDKAAAEFRAAAKRVLELRADATTPAAELAAGMAAAREAVGITACRLAAAREADAHEQAMTMWGEARKLKAEAERLEGEADHLDRTARGTVAALYGTDAAELLQSRGKRCLQAQALRREAEALRGRSDCLEQDAKSTEQVVPALPSAEPFSLSALAPAQMAGRLEDILAGLNDGRLQE